MKTFFSNSDAIIELHRQGFTNDFQLFGNDLFWVQGKYFIRTGEFDILKFFRIINKSSNEVSTVFGILAPYHNIKGILLDHYKSYSEKTPPILVKKLSEAGFQPV